VTYSLQTHLASLRYCPLTPIVDGAALGECAGVLLLLALVVCAVAGLVRAVGIVAKRLNRLARGGVDAAAMRVLDVAEAEGSLTAESAAMVV
jgi:hypothetical protein